MSPSRAYVAVYQLVPMPGAGVRLVLVHLVSDDRPRAAWTAAIARARAYHRAQLITATGSRDLPRAYPAWRAWIPARQPYFATGLFRAIAVASPAAAFAVEAS